MPGRETQAGDRPSAGGRPADEGVSAAGASAWARYRALSARHRQERLVVRLALAASSGVIGSGLADWRTGLAAAVAMWIVHAVRVHNRPGPMTNWRRGALAERRTGRLLARMDPASFRMLHDRALPGVPTANLDHLVIGVTGIYAVASRRWRIGARLWSDRRRLWVGNRPIDDLQVAMARCARTVADRLATEIGHDVPVSPLVAVHGARVPRAGLRHRGMVLQRVRRVSGYIGEQPVVLTAAQVATIALVADRVLPPMPGFGDHIIAHSVNL